MIERPQTIFKTLNPGAEYTIISNKLCKDRELSMPCKGFLMTVLCLPDDWDFKPSWLMKEFNIGRNEVYRLITEAIDAGYCLKINRRSSSGRLTGQLEYVFCGDPKILADRFPTCREIGADRYTDIPISGKSVRLLSKDLNTNYSPKAHAGEIATEDDQQPVTFVNGDLQLHGVELETYLQKFDGDTEALQSALIQTAACIQPNSSRPLIAQVRRQLQIKLDQRRDFRQRNEARDAAWKAERAKPPRQFESARERKAREAGDIISRLARGDL